MNDEQVLAIIDAIKDISNSVEHGFHYQPEPSHDRIVHAMDGVSESIEKLNSSLVESLRRIQVELDIISSNPR